MIRVAINGFGRIGRIAFRQMITSTYFDIVAINSLSSDPEEYAYLLKYDSIHGTFHENEISSNENSLIIANKKIIKIFNEKDPENLPWKDLNVDLVLECSGAFTSTEKASKHLNAGAKKVLISAPGKDEMPTIVNGVNDNILTKNETIVSAASCTTNCLAPLLKAVEEGFGIKIGFMTTVHAITSDQSIMDNDHHKGFMSRRGRSAYQNIVPASTGAASSIGKVIPSLNGKIDGVAFRVPVMDGSVIDLSLVLNKNVTVDELNNYLISKESDVLKVSKMPLVSSDVIGRKCGCLVDLLSTKVEEVDGNQMVKLVAWYDNEYGYTSQMLEVAKRMF